jgi:hypothetical protein
VPSLSIQFNPELGPLVQVLVWKRGFMPQGTAAMPPNPTPYNALIDTGASCSCVSDKVIKAEGLILSGKQAVSDLHGTQRVTAVGWVSGASRHDRSAGTAPAA